MAGASKESAAQDIIIDEIELDASEMKELDELAEDTRKCSIVWNDLKAELSP
jgi:hypothetical protein